MVANIRISGAQTFPYSESDIRVNFNDASKIIAAANAISLGEQGQFYSSDSGATWGQTSLPLTGWEDVDLTLSSGGPGSAVGDPFAYTTNFPGQGLAARVVYRTSDDHIHELASLDPAGAGWEDVDLTLSSGGPGSAVGDPFAYTTNFPGQGLAARVVYRTSDDHIHELASLDPAGAGWEDVDLTLSSGGPGSAVGDPFAYTTNFPGQGLAARVVYRTSDDHIHELASLDPAGAGWEDVDLTLSSGGPGSAVGDPFAYTTNFPGQGLAARVVYRTSDDHIHELASLDPAGAGWEDVDLTLSSGGPGSAVGDPFAYTTNFPGQGLAARVVYRTSDDHIHELASLDPAGAGWEDVDLTLSSGGPGSAVGDPFAYTTNFPGQGLAARVVYRTSDDHIHELASLDPAGIGWQDADLGALGSAVGDPFAYTTNFPAQGLAARVVCRTSDDHIHELASLDGAIGTDALHSDPCVDWTSDGTAWSITIGIDSSLNQLRLRSYKSTDGGATWKYDADASQTQTATDKQMVWVDHSPTSPYKDNIYVIWHNNKPVFVNRRTGPLGSWQSPVQVSGAETTGTGIGGDIKTNSFGDVFAFWPDTGSGKLLVAKSTDGGVTFAAPVTIATTFDRFDIPVPSFNLRRALISISGGAYRTATKDLVYALWVDLTGVAGCTSAANEPGSSVGSSCKTRIWFSRSTDGGTTWADAQMINDKSSKNDQFNHKLAVDEVNGQLVVTYYDTVRDSRRLQTDLWMQTSNDDGVTWSSAFRVSTAKTDETGGGADSGNQYGDYNGLSGIAGAFYPSWTDRRDGAKEEIWVAPITVPLRFTLAVGNPFAYTTNFPGQGLAARVVYRTSDGHIHELASLDPAGIGWEDVDLGGPGSAVGDPFGYTTSFPGQGRAARVVYCTSDGHVHELASLDPAGAGWEDVDLTLSSGGPGSAVGDPFGYTTNFHGQGLAARVVYRTSDGHIHELASLDPAGIGWRDVDLGGPGSAAGDPFGYTTNFPAQGRAARVVYCTSDGHIHELASLNPAGLGWEDVDLTLNSGGPGSAVGDPFGYTTSFPGQGLAARVVYCTSDGHIHELASLDPAGAGWEDVDLGGPGDAAGDPFGYTTSFPGQGRAARVVYRTSDGHIHELASLNPAGIGWQDVDLGGPGRAVGDPLGYTTTFPTQGLAGRVVYCTSDGHIHELASLNPAGIGWQDVDLTVNGGGGI